MYKIELRDKRDRLVRSRKYETRLTFLKWLKYHKAQYASCYNIIAYRLTLADPPKWRKIIAYNL